MWVSAFFPGAGLRAKRKGMASFHALHPLRGPLRGLFFRQSYKSSA
nr:MAG TPA: hypothetical protein [Caudoviricetes sp.]